MRSNKQLNSVYLKKSMDIPTEGKRVSVDRGNVRRDGMSTTTEVKNKNDIPIPEYNEIISKHANRLQFISLLGMEQSGLGTLYLRINTIDKYDVSYIGLGKIDSPQVRQQISDEKEHDKFFFIVGQKNATFVISRLKRTITKGDLQMIFSEPMFAKYFKGENKIKKGSVEDLKAQAKINDELAKKVKSKKQSA